VSNGLEKIWKEAKLASFKTTFPSLTTDIEKKSRKQSVSVAGREDEI
jgi:hypothetical protein